MTTPHKAMLIRARDALLSACGGRCNAEYNPCEYREVADALTVAIDAPEPEPVAWRVSHTASYTGRPECRVTELFDYLPLNKYFACSNPVTEALYLHPPTVREPLTGSEIMSMAYDCNAMPESCTDKTLTAFARAIEAAHGIGAKP